VKVFINTLERSEQRELGFRNHVRFS
jgi:hypothetical protein